MRQLGVGDALCGRAVRVINEHLAKAGDWDELRQLLNEWDPIGVYNTGTALPPDEYDCLRVPVMNLLAEGASAAVVARFLDQELQEHFGLDPGPRKTQEFAARLTLWFRATKA